MNIHLAEQLLAKIMDWKSEILAEERFYIQMFSELKFDNYQQYSQGMKFIESLSLWLNCFSKEDRHILYNFIKDQLIYISENQMRTLVEISFPFYISPIIREKALSICDANINKDFSLEKLCNFITKQSLFLGLSDGSHIDLFRRSNSSYLSNEQISVYYDISKDRLTDMISDMPEESVLGRGVNNIFLLDDFSGSGVSFIRKEGDKWKGKVIKLLTRLKKYDMDITNIDLSLILYVSTDDAVKYINNKMEEYKQEDGIEAKYHVRAIQRIEKPTISDDVCRLLSKYYTKYQMSDIEDIHFKKGKHLRPYLGFNECSLPLVLFHNTPNNSLPIIWFNENKQDKTYYGLFPRVTRHKEV